MKKVIIVLTDDFLSSEIISDVNVLLKTIYDVWEIVGHGIILFHSAIRMKASVFNEPKRLF